MTTKIEDAVDKYSFIKQSDVSSEWNYRYEPNQFYQESLNVLSLSPFDNTTSGARKQMFGASHIAQALAIKGSNPRRIQTGAEGEYGKATFSVKAEADCEVLKIIHLYPTNQIGKHSIKHNPETILIVERYDTNEIDFIKLTGYTCNHQYFGFAHKPTEACNNIVVGTRLKKGTILQDSPNKHADGNYCYGRELNMVYANFPACSEDGVILSEEALPWLETSKFEKRTISWGSSHFAVNIYGDDDNYQPFPNIGDKIRPDGLLGCLRSYDKNFSMVEMSARNLRQVSYTHDKLIYVPAGEGVVVDLRIRHDATQQIISPHMCNEQAHVYDEARRVFYQEIMDYYNKVLKRRYEGRAPKMTHEFKQLIKTAYSVVVERKPDRRSGSDKAPKIYRGSAMDDFTIDFVIEYKNRPVIGYKLTSTWGG